MSPERNRYSVDLDRLGIDWDEFGRRIDERIALRRERPALTTRRKALIAAGLLIAAVVVGIHLKRADRHGGEETYLYGVSIESYDKPESFRVLSGYSDDHDFLTMADYIVGYDHD